MMMLSGYRNVNPLEQSNIDIEIIHKNISPTGLEHIIEQGLFFQVNDNEIWFNVPNTARFLVQYGERILFDLAPGVNEASISVFLNGPCLVALLMQRNLFVLKGSVINVHDAAVAYIGENCSGKSSVVAAMMQSGYSVLSDELCVINREGMVLPGPGFIELWEDSAQALNIPAQVLHDIRPEFKKYRLYLHQLHENRPLPLGEIYVLNPKKENVLRHTNLTSGEKINFLQKNIYNKTYLAGLQKNHLYFEYCARLASQINMALIEFNGMEFNIQDVTTCIAGRIAGYLS